MLFVDNANTPLSRDFLVENLRGIEWQTCDRSVDVLVSRLRNKLGETPNRTRFLKTIHGVGYKFVDRIELKTYIFAKKLMIKDKSLGQIGL